jgi:CRP/FNR family transcriptional regulator, cyclic AMP receptor protein
MRMRRSKSTGMNPANRETALRLTDQEASAMPGIPFNWIDALGYLGMLLVLATCSTKRMIPLRVFSIAANCVFIIYAFLASVYPQLFLQAILLPLNALRLYEMLQLTEKVEVASRGDLSMDWLKQFMTKRAATTGEVLFRKGDLATAMFYTVTGRYCLPEAGIDVGPGEVIGEIGIIAPGNKRMLTFECVEGGDLLIIGYPQVKQLYYQNPEFGFYLLQLISHRLIRGKEPVLMREARTTIKLRTA